MYSVVSEVIALPASADGFRASWAFGRFPFHGRLSASLSQFVVRRHSSSQFVVRHHSSSLFVVRRHSSHSPPFVVTVVVRRSSPFVTTVRRRSSPSVAIRRHGYASDGRAGNSDSWCR